MGSVTSVRGLCACGSVQLFTLQVTEHMLFYARLKGVHIAEEWDHVQSLLRCVGLRRYQNRLASQLSGGMQRRLSVAISLCGDPSIVILDEPTTGTCTVPQGPSPLPLSLRTGAAGTTDSQADWLMAQGVHGQHHSGHGVPEGMSLLVFCSLKVWDCQDRHPNC